MNLVIGATGMLGFEVCHQLVAEGEPVKAMVRKSADPEKTRKLESMGVELVYGDLREPSCFKPVLSNIETVISTVSSMPFSYVSGENDIQRVDFEGMLNFIDSAKLYGVQHFIYTSFSKQLNIDFPLRNAKRSVESHLMKSEMPFTILRPSCFMEVWLSPAVGFDIEHAKVSIYGEGDQPVSYISYFDVATFAVKCLDNKQVMNKAFELGGPQAISQLQAVEIFEKITGETFEKQFVPVNELQEQRKTASDPMQKSFAGLMECVAQGDKIEMTPVTKVVPIKLTTIEEFAYQTMAFA